MANLGVGLDEFGGLSTNEVSVVLHIERYQSLNYFYGLMGWIENMYIGTHMNVVSASNSGGILFCPIGRAIEGSANIGINC